MKVKKSFLRWYDKNWPAVHAPELALVICKAAWKRGVNSTKRTIPRDEPPRS